MAKQAITPVENQEKVLTEHPEFETPQVEPIAPKHLQFLIEKGEFWFDGIKYHHNALDQETAEKLIEKGYTKIRFQ